MMKLYELSGMLSVSTMHRAWWPNCRWDGALSVFAVYTNELYIRVEG